ncbi:hypothetical protein KAK06_04145 [Ideonella sp. 4Y11]|uniref:DUF4124 domain-containing protein n=1 Tax=Ideonella aquatica TaxID=2824119 RepID=A0A941BPJ9_9BURK|nr:hypothetical protein [Ideonella aquatica]MBQ0958140.1 hypothetical protein [Ideonella aquatica]
MPTPPRSTRPLRVLCGGLLWLGLSAAQAEVYRCGSSYQDSPCAGGRTVDVDDARSPEQRAEARERLQQEQARAKALATERHAQERTRRPATAPAGIPVRQPDDLDALPSDHPCARPTGKHPGKAKARVQCLNGLPVYKAQARPPGR